MAWYDALIGIAGNTLDDAWYTQAEKAADQLTSEGIDAQNRQTQANVDIAGMNLQAAQQGAFVGLKQAETMQQVGLAAAAVIAGGIAIFALK